MTTSRAIRDRARRRLRSIPWRFRVAGLAALALTTAAGAGLAIREAKHIADRSAYAFVADDIGDVERERAIARLDRYRTQAKLEWTACVGAAIIGGATSVACVVGLIVDGVRYRRAGSSLRGFDVIHRPPSR